MDIDKYIQIRNYDGKKLLFDIPLLVFWGWLLLLVADTLKTKFPQYIVSSPDSIRLLVWLFFVLILFATSKPLLKFLKCLFLSVWPWSKTKNYQFDNDLKSLIYQGWVEIKNDSLYITNSESGFLIKNLWWKDFTATFNFKFDKTEIAIVRGIFNKQYIIEDKIHHFNFVGFLFRAQSLEDYFMFSVGVSKNNDDYHKLRNKNSIDVIITPHIRLGGKWERFGGRGLGTIIKINSFNFVRCEVVGTTATIEINGKSFVWNLPTNFDKVVVDSERKEGYDPAKLANTNSSTIPFRNNFGMIGFRATGAENVLIKDVVIKRLG